jgi:ABC-2 type transport system ATP-binding protein
MSDRLPPRVSVRELTKRYGAVAAVRDISFEVAAGEIFGLLGPNGAGKTTTLECILGLRRPDAGAIAIDGIDALAQPERAKQRVGAQLQAATLQRTRSRPGRRCVCLPPSTGNRPTWTN